MSAGFQMRELRTEVRKKEMDCTFRPNKITLVDDSDNEQDLFDTLNLTSKFGSGEDQSSLNHREDVPMKSRC